MAARMVARTLLGSLRTALREVERQADTVAEVLVPGPLGLVGAKLPPDVADTSARLVADAKRRWAESQGGATTCGDAPPKPA